MATVIRKQFRTDAAGTYIAYTFDDGHVETSPPNRPLSKEDLQRELRIREALSNAKSIPTSDWARSRSVSQQVNRDTVTSSASRATLKDFNDSIKAFSVFSATASAPAPQSNTLLESVALGGELPDDAPEYIPSAVRATSTSSTGRNFTTAVIPIENRRT